MSTKAEVRGFHPLISPVRDRAYLDLATRGRLPSGLLIPKVPPRQKRGILRNKKPPRGVLLMAYGSPERLRDVEAYFTDIKGGIAPAPAVLRLVRGRYRLVGGRTPLNKITASQVRHLQRILDKREGRGRYKVYAGMKHWHPFIRDAMKKIAAEGVRDLTAIVLAPHYSRLSIGGYEKRVKEATGQLRFKPPIRFVKSWHTNRFLIDCIATQIKEAERTLKPVQRKNLYIVFTAHSLPKKIRKFRDPYERQLKATCSLVAKKLSIKKFAFAFQSAGHTGEEWLGPDIEEVLAGLKKKGTTSFLIAPVGFVSDNLEIVYDIDIELKAFAKKNGIFMRRTKLRNTHPLFIEALYDIVTS